MNILFLCGSLAFGQDGVGDYTRRLAQACIEQGHACTLIALNDKAITNITEETQSNIPCLRFPKLPEQPNEHTRLHAFIKESNPDYISLQFVPYSFHPKGLVKPLIPILKALNTEASWHIMFHEIWIGCAQKAPLKERLIGLLQKHQIKALFKTLSPQSVHSHTPAYLHLLKSIGCQANQLPLFGNIERQPTDAAQWLEPILKENGLPAVFDSRDNHWLIGIFGTIHPQWPPEPLLYYLEAAARTHQKKIILISFGHDPCGKDMWRSLSRETRQDMHFLRLGSMESKKVSELMNSLDFGISTSPWSLIHKSGCAIAMLEHGLPILINRDDITFKNFDHTTAPLPQGLHHANETLPQKLVSIERFQPQTNIHKVQKQFLDEIGGRRHKGTEAQRHKGKNSPTD